MLSVRAGTASCCTLTPSPCGITGRTSAAIECQRKTQSMRPSRAGLSTKSKSLVQIRSYENRCSVAATFLFLSVFHRVVPLCLSSVVYSARMIFIVLAAAAQADPVLAAGRCCRTHHQRCFPSVQNMDAFAHLARSCQMAYKGLAPPSVHPLSERLC